MSAAPVPNRLVVLASFDPEGEVAPHLRHHIEAWQGECRRLIVVTTSRLTDEARTWLSAHVELLERENYGYDFYSYRTGLLAAGDLADYDEVVICNDTFVGPLRPYARIFAEMAEVRVDFWGMTRSERIKPHAQSFFVVFRRWVLGSKAFRSFWEDLVPVSDRRQVIHRYEIGLSQALVEAGFALGSYFVESPAERRRARVRVAWWVLHRKDAARDLRKLRTQAGESWNPTYGLADSALHDARLPLVKLDVLRFDPYGLGAGRLLERCSRAYPTPFAGLPDYLRRTSSFYPPRPAERLRSTPLALRPLRALVAYR